MKTQIQKWGNSLAIRIPKAFAQEIFMDHGSIVDLAIEQGEIIIRPVSEPAYSLEELLADVTQDNLHGEILTGAAQGQEAW